MRLLIMLAGAPGSGKSTLIKKNNVEDLVISPDELRKQYVGVMPTRTDKTTYSLSFDAEVWKTAKSMVETHMKMGQTIIFDSTCVSDISFFTKTAKQYRYRVCFVYIDNVTAEECIKRVNSREKNNCIPDEVIVNFVTRLENKFKNKNSNVYRASQFEDPLKEVLKWNDFYLQDFNKYNEVKIIPDLHGQFDCFTNFIENELNPIGQNTHYIFLGDYIDRGSKSLETLNFVLDNIDNPQFTFLVGNHEVRLFEWAQNISYKASFGFKATLREFYEKLSKDEVEKLKHKIISKMNKFKSYVYMTFKNETYFINHSGVDKMYNNMPDAYLTGKITYGYNKDNTYPDYIEVGEKWKENHPNIVQIFGHRNVHKIDEGYINGVCFCLECDIENGKDLHVLTLPHYAHTYYHNPKTNILTFEEFQENKYIIRKDFYEHKIYSLNFSKEVFYKKMWTDITMKTRGLYKYQKDNSIAGRSYNKFFNIGEREETKLEMWANDVMYPLYVYKKENGYLGIMFYNKELDKLEFATKSIVGGRELNDAFENIFTEIEKNSLKTYCRKKDCSIIFEVISNVDNDHPIKYKDECVVVLDIIKNTDDEQLIDIENLRDYLNETSSEHTKIKWKETFDIIFTKDEFINFIKECEKDYEKLDLEGFVICDSSKIVKRVKFKTNFYNIKKTLRGMYARETDIFPNHSRVFNKIVNALYPKFTKETWKNITIEDVKDEYDRIISEAI